MFVIKIFEKIRKKVKNSWPETTNRFRDNLEKKVGNALQDQLLRFNFINRKEFDAQNEKLFDINEKIVILERKLKTLEEKQVLENRK